MTSGSLLRRLARLEADRRGRARLPCRRHERIVLVDDALPAGDPRRGVPPLCDAPDTCPGTGLQIWIGEGDEPEAPHRQTGA